MPQNTHTGNNTGVQTNNGGNPSRGPMLKNYDMERIVIREARKQTPFTQMAKRTNISKNKGNTLKKRRKFPILHDKNVNSQGVDPLGLTLTTGKWYAYTGDFEAGTEVRTEHDTKAAADAVANVTRVVQGTGNLFGSSRDFYRQTAAVPALSELGGRVNIVGATQVIVEGKIKLYSLSEEFTREELDLGEEGLKAEKTLELGVAYADLHESMVRNDLIQQGLSNAVKVGAAATIKDIDGTSLLTYDAVRAFQKKLDLLMVPMDSNIIAGSTNIGTYTVEAARALFIPIGLETSFEQLKLGDKYVFKYVSEYAKAAGSSLNDRDKTAEKFSGEIGSVGKFRIISEYGMPTFEGAGASATDGADADGDGLEDEANTVSTTDGKYDVFPILSVGAGAFEVLGLEGETVKVRYVDPQIVPGLDNTGEIGVVSVRWHQGMLFNKPEWVNVMLCAGRK